MKDEKRREQMKKRKGYAEKKSKCWKLSNLNKFCLVAFLS